MSQVALKLAKARKMFLQENVEKSGKNMNLQFKYFELSDIVPPATRIFDEVGLLVVMNMDEANGVGVATVYDAENPSDTLEFTIPFFIDPSKLNKEGKEITPKTQRIGMSITYTRRYLWMLVMDVVEQDQLDAGASNGEEKEKEQLAKPDKKKAPKSKEQREDIKKDLVANDNPTKEEIETLKGLCSELVKLDEDKEEMVRQIELKTEAYTKLTKDQCVQLSTMLKAMVDEYGK